MREDYLLTLLLLLLHAPNPRSLPPPPLGTPTALRYLFRTYLPTTLYTVYSLRSIVYGTRTAWPSVEAIPHPHLRPPPTHINHLRNHLTFSLFIGILEQRVESSSGREIRLFADSANLLVLLFI